MRHQKGKFLIGPQDYLFALVLLEVLFLKKKLSPLLQWDELNNIHAIEGRAMLLYDLTFAL